MRKSCARSGSSSSTTDQLRLPSLIVSHNRHDEEKQALKERFLECLHMIPETLRPVVTRLLAFGVKRDELVEWAVGAGYSRSFIRSLLSRLFCDNGQRSRRAGAGRKTPQEALALLAFAQNQFGERAPKYLLAAYRAAKAQSAMHLQSGQVKAA